LRMLAKAPEERFAAPAEVAEAMRPFTAGCDLRRLVAEVRRGPQPSPPAGRPSPDRPSRLLLPPTPSPA